MFTGDLAGPIYDCGRLTANRKLTHCRKSEARFRVADHTPRMRCPLILVLHHDRNEQVLITLELRQLQRAYWAGLVFSGMLASASS